MGACMSTNKRPKVAPSVTHRKTLTKVASQQQRSITRKSSVSYSILTEETMKYYRQSFRLNSYMAERARRSSQDKIIFRNNHIHPYVSI